MTNREWVEHWRRVGPQLEQVRRAELRALDYEAQLPALEALLDIACKLATSNHQWSRRTPQAPRTKGEVNALFQGALEAQRFIQERKWSFCIIGGMAVLLELETLEICLGPT